MMIRSGEIGLTEKYQIILQRKKKIQSYNLLFISPAKNMAGYKLLADSSSLPTSSLGALCWWYQSRSSLPIEMAISLHKAGPDSTAGLSDGVQS